MSNLKYFNEDTQEWEYLVIGKQGPQGAPGIDGNDGIVSSETPPENTDILWLDLSDTEDQLVIPAGGETGQVLTKASNTDFDTEWSQINIPLEDVSVTQASESLTVLRNITLSTDAPDNSEGMDGDIWLVYEA